MQTDVRYEIEHNYAKNPNSINSKEINDTCTKNNHSANAKRLTDHKYSRGDEFSIATLNVCGLKSKLRSDEFIHECALYDLMFLQETKTDVADEEIIKDLIMTHDLGIAFTHRIKNSQELDLVGSLSYTNRNTERK